MSTGVTKEMPGFIRLRTGLLMEIIRQKAAEALRLIEASDERESTVEIRYSFQDT